MISSLANARARKALLTVLLLFTMAAVVLAACSAQDQEAFQDALDVDTPFFSISPDSSPVAPASAAAQAGETPEPSPEENSEAQVEAENEQIIFLEEVIIALLFVAVLVGIVAHRLRVPYTIGLVLMGLVLTLRSQIEVSIPPNLILALLVPPLIFEAAFHLNLDNLRRNLAPILALAVPGVLLTTLLVGAIVAWGTGLSLPVALVFGALVSATDPVSVVALFRSMGAPKRLQLLLEGESLFNDGTAIVIFRLVLLFAISSAATFNLAFSLIDFVRIAGGGLVVGLVLGTLVSQMISRIDDYLIETTLTSVLAFGAYLVAEALGVSGVLAVVAAGLINGNIGPRGMSPTTRIVLFNFWEYAAFLSNSFIFLLIGLRIELPLLFGNWHLILWGIGAVLLARIVSVYGLAWIGRDIPLKWQHVLYWGGLRGAISLALALSLPAALDAREQIQVMAFGVVLFSLLVQGFTMEPLVRLFKLAERSEMLEEYERRHARAVASRTAYDHLRRQHLQGLISEHSWKIIAPIYQERNAALAEAVREVLAANPQLEAEELDTARREMLRSQRSTLYTLFKDGVISEENYSLLVSEVDSALTDAQSRWQDLIGITRSYPIPVDRLMAVIVQEQDAEDAVNGLTKLGLMITSLNSRGGFLGNRSNTLLIGFRQGQEEAIVRVLQLSCRSRVEYLPALAEAIPVEVFEPLPVTVHGATIFTFRVERFEVF